MGTIIREITGSAPPFNSVKDEIADVGGVELEFLFEGTATEYHVAAGADYSQDGEWDAEPSRRATFRSRMLVLRPGDPTAFNGTVVVTWNNVSMGQDRFNRTRQAPPLIEDGFALVGVTTQMVGLVGRARQNLPGPGYRNTAEFGLVEHDPERYGILEHPGDGFSYDIFTQAGELLGENRSGRIDPLDGLDVRHLVASGGSQAGSRMATYRNAVHPLTSVYDAYLIAVYGGCPCVLDPATAPEHIREIPANPVQLLPWRTYRLRDDLQVPTIVLQSELEAELCYPNNQPDTESLRFWEFAGSAHRGLWPPEWMESTEWMEGANQVSFWPAYRAALHALQRWLEGGAPPPHQPRLEKAGNPPVLPRDEHGNAIGGIRLPDVEAPLGTHIGESPSEGYVQLNGTSTPFPPEKVRALYTDRDAWFAKYRAAVDQLVATQVFLPDDAEQVLQRAATMEFST
jgi:hypothetical protein